MAEDIGVFSLIPNSLHRRDYVGSQLDSRLCA